MCASDEHPFHLPHIWNSCDAPSGCTLNLTTLTMPLLGSGPLFPNASSAPLSALEMRAKLKSRQTVWQVRTGSVDARGCGCVGEGGVGARACATAYAWP